MLRTEIFARKNIHCALAAIGLSAMAFASSQASATALSAYNADPSSVSVSGLSSGAFMAVQLGVAYSNTFPVGFGVFAGGPFDCARNQNYTSCMYNATPSITTPVNNMKSWSGSQIDTTANLANRKIYMWTGSSDTTVGPNVMGQLKSQLANFDNSNNVSYVTTSGAAHTFPTDFSGSGDNSCGSASSPYISNCTYDGAGAVLKWMYGSLNARNTGTLGGSTVSFDQSGSYTASGMAGTGYLYVPANCASGGSTVCKLHVALHGCLQNYGNISSKFIDNTGYNKWADTNNIIILYPQTTADSTSHSTWDSGSLANSNACWDWIGWYGSNADQKGGSQMAALVAMVNKITSGYSGGSSTTTTTAGGGTTTTTATTTTTTQKYSQAVSATVTNHYIAGRINVTQYNQLGAKYGYNTVITLYLCGSTWTNSSSCGPLG
ncbi:MAG: extracellular catalytic domain type 2 short-chain-length polyhydroxyalkanoate depolymerase [Limisphaerales bacterium]